MLAIDSVERETQFHLIPSHDQPNSQGPPLDPDLLYVRWPARDAAFGMRELEHRVVLGGSLGNSQINVLHYWPVSLLLVLAGVPAPAPPVSSVLSNPAPAAAAAAAREAAPAFATLGLACVGGLGGGGGGGGADGIFGVLKIAPIIGPRGIRGSGRNRSSDAASSVAETPAA